MVISKKGIMMHKTISSFLSLSLLLVPTHFYGMESKPADATPSQEFVIISPQNTQANLSASQITSTQAATAPQDRLHSFTAQTNDLAAITALSESQRLRLNASSPQLTQPRDSTSAVTQEQTSPKIDTYAGTRQEILRQKLAQLKVQVNSPATSLSASVPTLSTTKAPIEPLAHSTLTTRTATEDIVTYEEKSGIFDKLWYINSTYTEIALDQVASLTPGKKPANSVGLAHQCEWAIDEILKEINKIKTRNKAMPQEIPTLLTDKKKILELQIANVRSLSDGFRKTIREQEPYLTNLETILSAAKRSYVPINEDSLTRSSTVLTSSRNEALLLASYSNLEAKYHLQNNKRLRRDIYDTKEKKHEVKVPSDDEYDDVSLCEHYLHVAKDMNFIDFR